MAGVVMAKIDHLHKLLPVGQEHINYLESELLQTVGELVMEKNEYLSSETCEVMRLELTILVQAEIRKIDLENGLLVEEDIKDYLTRRMTELHPTLISLQLSQFSHKFEQTFQDLKKDCQLKYQPHFSSHLQLERTYCHFIERDVSRMFHELVNKWRITQNSIQEQMLETSRLKSLSTDEVSRLKEEKRNTASSLENFRREEGRSLSKLKVEMEETYKEELLAIVTDYEGKLRTAEERRDREVRTSTTKADLLQQEKQELSRSMQY